jgi:GAF domain-containing protein
MRCTRSALLALGGTTVSEPRDDSPARDGSVDQPNESIELDLAEAFAELANIRLDAIELGEVLARIARLAKACLSVADAVSVTLVSDEGPAATVAHTDEVALALDESQYGRGYGPCLEAAHGQQTVLTEVAQADERWPNWAEVAQEVGIRSSVSVGLPAHQAVEGALNLYCRRAGVLNDHAVEVLTAFAGYAAVVVANAHLYATTSTLADRINDAIKTRAVIEQAKGVLVAQQHVTPDEAFNILARASQVGNRKLHDIARAIVAGAEEGGRSST